MLNQVVTLEIDSMKNYVIKHNERWETWKFPHFTWKEKMLSNTPLGARRTLDILQTRWIRRTHKPVTFLYNLYFITTIIEEHNPVAKKKQKIYNVPT